WRRLPITYLGKLLGSFATRRTRGVRNSNTAWRCRSDRFKILPPAFASSPNTGRPPQDRTPDAGGAGAGDAVHWTRLAASGNGPPAVRHSIGVPPHAGTVRCAVARIAGS